MSASALQIDIITPVYNNKQYIERCLASAHDLEEVNKIIVVDDGSTDGTLALLHQLKSRFNKLEVLTHPGNVNRGIACSRNLAIQNATSPWIAFLDSDDYYLPGRFDHVKEIILKDESVNGIYDPVVNEVISENGATRFSNHSKLHHVVIGINPDRDPKNAFESMYFGKGGGAVHLNGLTVKRSLAKQVGLFDENLRIVDDSVFRLKVAYVGSFTVGSKQPVAVRTIHDTNSEPNIGPFDVFMKHKVLLDFFLERKAPKKLIRNAVKRVLYYYLEYKGAKMTLHRGFWMLIYLLKNPGVGLAYL